MAGRYPGELFVRVVGDERAARDLLPAARLVMGQALEAAETNGLGSYTVRRELQDGSVIVAEKIGDLKRVTISAGGSSTGNKVEPGGGFILWPRWNTIPFDPYSGDMVDPLKLQPNGWLEFAGSAKITRYWDNWDGVVENIKGARFERFDTPELYPDGLRYYGNVDWKNGKDWQLSFYGYYSRYVRDVIIPDATAQYVFAQGQLLFARDQYVAELDQPPEWDGWRINSACMRENSLNGHTEMIVAFTDYRTGRPTTAQSMFVAFRLLLNDGAAPKGDWRVVIGSHYTLGTTPGKINPEQPSSADNFVTSDSPWFFNASGTAAIRTINSEPTDIASLVNTITQMVEIGSTSIDYSSEQQPYLIGNYNNGISAFALVEPTRSIVASDFVGDERVDLYLNFKVSQGQYFDGPFYGTLQVEVTLELPSGGEIKLMDRNFAQGADRLSYYQPVYLDLRHDMYAGWHVIGENGVHWIESFAYMAGNMQYGERELINWDPSSGTGQPFLGLDTRVDENAGGIVYSARYTGPAGPGWGPRLPGESGILWRRHPRQALTYFGATSAVATSMGRSELGDAANFPWIGGWNFNKGRYCVSMPGAYGVPLNYVTGGNMAELLGITADQPRFWPLTALPKAI